VAGLPYDFNPVFYDFVSVCGIRVPKRLNGQGQLYDLDHFYLILIIFLKLLNAELLLHFLKI
jgi:hypothetical protein